MTSVPLEPLASLVDHGSTVVMADRLDQLKARFRDGEWWHPHNREYRGIVRKVNLTQKPSPEDVSTYIAASITLHMMDGWTLLSRSFEALAHGDFNTAIHLGYYAELRAALSILAASGIGLFNTRHIAVAADGSLHPWPRDLEDNKNANNVIGTHKAVWTLLNAWADRPSNGTRLLKSLTVNSITLADWLDDVVDEITRNRLRAGSPSDALRGVVAKDWLQAWSIDLIEFEHDRNLRNLVSYGPAGILGAQPEPLDPASELWEPLKAHWSALAPARSAEAAVDVSLLMSALRSLYAHRLPAIGWADITKGIETLRGKLVKDRLASVDSKFRPLLKVASTRATQSKPLPVLARATLLLRLASALAGDVLNRASVSKEELQFWWLPFGQDLAFWDDPPADSQFLGLWDGVVEALRSIEDELGLPINVTYERMCSSVGRYVPATQFARAPFWLLGIER